MAPKTFRGVMYFNHAIQRLLKAYQINYLGFADLSNYQEEIVKTGNSIVENYKSGISIGIALQNSIVDFLPKRFDSSIACEYRLHAYEIINQRLNYLSSLVASYIDKMGYKALPIPAADRINKEKAYASISHKMIAHIAGLGWIGKNCLLITPENGPRVRFISILTNAPLKTVDKPTEQKCNDCADCIKICPSKALLGVNYQLGDERDIRFEYEKCENYYVKLKNQQEYVVCGMCLYACPYGKKSSNRPRHPWLGRFS
jgi:epoxyqueuosine reductase